MRLPTAKGAAGVAAGVGGGVPVPDGVSVAELEGVPVVEGVVV
jgi:hypothetical protein